MSSSSSSNVNVDNVATGSFTEQPQATDNDSSLTQVLYMGRDHSAPGNQDTATVYCKVRIVGIQNSSKWFYYTCPTFFSLKGVHPIDTTFWCSSCEEICAEPILRYKLKLEVTDEISLVGLTVIDEDAEFIVGKPAAALFAECEGNQDAADNMFQSIIGTSQIVEIKSHNYFEISDLEGFICTWVFKRNINRLLDVRSITKRVAPNRIPEIEGPSNDPSQ